MKQIKTIEDLPKDLRDKLFEMHTHAELCEPGEIVYKESDVLKIIELILTVSFNKSKPDI
jgi:hypothetical protein